MTFITNNSFKFFCVWLQIKKTSNYDQCQLLKYIPGNQIPTYILNHIHNGDLLIQHLTNIQLQKYRKILGTHKYYTVYRKKW